MSAGVCSEELESGKSRIACRACRSRKVKCNRELPWCSNCRNCGQQCIYPSTMLKPGPKLGSVHKRRRLENQCTQETMGPSPTTAQNTSTEEQQPPSSARSSPEIIGGDDSRLYSRHVKAVSELCHISNEDTSPTTTDINSSTDAPLQGHSAITIACGELGVSRAVIEQM